MLADVRASTEHVWSRFAGYWPDNVAIEEVFPAAFETWEGEA